jgi:hypothetical protein
MRFILDYQQPSLYKNCPMKNRILSGYSAVGIFLGLLPLLFPISSAKADIYQTGFEAPFTEGGDLVGVDSWVGINTATAGSVGVISDGSGFQSGIAGSGFVGTGQSAFIGYSAPPGNNGTPSFDPFADATSVYAWRPVSNNNGSQEIKFSVDLAIYPAGNGQKDSYCFTVVNSNNEGLCGVNFTTPGGTGTIGDITGNLFNSATGGNPNGTATTYTLGTSYKLNIDVHFDTQKWGASLTGGEYASATSIFSDASFNSNTASDLAYIAAGWDLPVVAPTGTGYGFMAFDNYTITAIPEPSSASLALGGAVFLGGAMLMRRRRKV